MRFWPFGKRQRAETSDAPAPPPEPAPAAAPVPPRPPTGAWRQLPALRPTSAALALTAPVQRLTDTITSMQHPQVASAELGHARTPSGPTGSVGGLVRPHRNVQRLDGPVALTVAHAPEPVEAADAVPIRAWGTGAASTPTQRLPASPAPSTAPTSAAAPVPAAAPATTSPDQPPAAPAPVSFPSLPARSMPARPLPPTPVAPVVATTSAPTTAAAPVRDVQRLAEPVSAQTTSETPASPPAEPMPVIERSIAEAPPTATGTRPDAPTLGTTRIVRRIGAPMHSRPASMVDSVTAEPQGVQRLPVTAGSPPEAVGPTATPVPETVTSVPGELPVRAARPLPHAEPPPVRTSSPPPAPSAASVGAAPADAPLVGVAAAIQRLPGAAPSLTIPRMATPDGPAPSAADVVPARRGVQRAPEAVPPTVRSELEPVLGESLSDVKVHRGPETGAAAQAIQAKAFTTGGAVYMPDEHGSTASGEGRKILAHELTHVVQQRALGGSLPSEDSAEGARLEHEARVVGGQAPVPTRPVAAAGPATSRPAAAGPAQRLVGSPMPSPSRALPAVPGADRGSFEAAPMPLSSQAAIVATVQAAATRAGVPSGPASQSSASAAATTSPAPAAAPGPSVAAPAVQRLRDEASSATSTESVAASSASSSAATRTEHVSEPDSSGEDNLDDLERQLYPRIRTRLKRDLLADRERSGRLFDR